MNSILVLTDFSKASSYAASYACVLARQLNCKEIVLYHSYESVITTGDNLTLISSDSSMQEMAMNALKEHDRELREQVPDGTSIRYRADHTGLLEINSIAAEEGAWIIVMGTTGKSKLEQIFLGSNAIRVCKQSIYPVMLVPVEISLQPAQRIVLAYDEKERNDNIPSSMIKKMADSFHLPVTLLSVDKGDEENEEQVTANRTKLREALPGYDPAYEHISNPDIAAGIVEFALACPSPIVMLIGRKHSFLEGFFHESVTRQLVNRAPVPVLVIPEKEAQLAL